MTTHSELPDAGRTPHYEIDRLLAALRGQGPIPGDLVIAAGNAVYFLTGTNTAKEQDNNWRITTTGNDLIIQSRISGTWTTEARFEA
jgi:hypothetical protein